MELQALLVLGGAGVAIIAMILLAGLFSTAGTSYEDAVAQQRKATTELLALATNKNKPKKAKKANKKLAKKERKESATAITASEPDSEAQGESGQEEEAVATTTVRPHVEFSPTVVVDAPSSDSPPNVKIRKRGKDPRVKPILINKEDPSCVTDLSTPPSPTSSLSNHFEEIHPKDDFELLHSAQAADKVQVAEKKEEVVVEKKDNKIKPKSGKAAKPAPAPEVPKEEVVVKERLNSVEAPKEQRKAKKTEKKPQVEDVVDAPREEIVPPLNMPQPSELTTEKLLKQAVAPPAAQPSPTVTSNKGKKNKKQELNMLSLMAGDGGGVNVSELVRLVTEAALSRNEIQILTETLLNKQHEQLPQHSEWTEGPNDPVQKLKKQLAEKEKALADEVEASQAIHAKLKELRLTLNAERSRATAATRASEEYAATQRAEMHTVQTRLQRLLDDNRAMSQEKMHLQSKLSVDSEMQTRVVQMEMHIQRLQEAEATLMQQVVVHQAESNARALEVGQARCEMSAARESLLVTQQLAADLTQQLQDANRVCGELDAQRETAVHSEQVALQEVRQLQERLKGVTDLQAEVQRLTSRAQLAESNLEKAKEEADKEKQQLSRELTAALESVAAHESELAELKLLKSSSAQNGLPSHNDTEHKGAEMAKVEAVIESLRGELTAAQRTTLEHRDQVAKLQEQLKQYQDKNNELRTKNWKVMEALQSAERALQTKSSSALPAQDTAPDASKRPQELQYSDVIAVLKPVCPSAAPATGDGRAWLETFAANLKKELVNNEQKTAPKEEKVDDLVAQNEQLQGAVDKYKRIIDDTEGVLSRLQANVTEEERRWARQLSEMQLQIDELSKRDTQSQKKVTSLEAELRQLKQNNGEHSFADSERLNEENSRLMAGLTDKHKVALEEI